MLSNNRLIEVYEDFHKVLYGKLIENLRTLNVHTYNLSENFVEIN